ncbi:hypothetical protein K4F52_008318 [Lecanicillium sp. MT-2017a]|nr:hypothetical protein K4F52_008318 [Lecanicillium sp. MT-2017a]
MVHVFSEVVRQSNKMEDDIANLWEFRILNNSLPVGYMPLDYIKTLDWTGTAFELSVEEKVIRLNPSIGPGQKVDEICTKNFVRVCQNNKDYLWGSLRRWLGRTPDYHAIRWLDPELRGLKIPTPLRGIFGVVTAGVHLNVYTIADEGGDEEKKLLWVSKRSEHVTFPGMFDQIVAGAMDPEDGDDPFLTLQREAWEEARLTLNIETKTMYRDGAEVGQVTGPHRITFYDFKDVFAGTEEGHLEPGVRFIFDLQVNSDFTPAANSEEEIEHFAKKSVEDVEGDLIAGRWKPSSALATLSFLSRTGFVAAKLAPESLEEIERQLQRELPLRCK